MVQEGIEGRDMVLNRMAKHPSPMVCLSFSEGFPHMERESTAPSCRFAFSGCASHAWY